MTILPKKVGPFTLMRKLGSDGVTESFVGILDEPAGKQVVVRQMLPWVARDPGRLQQVESRVQDLGAIRHPVLVPVLEEVPVGEDRFVVEEWVDAVDLDRVVQWCRENQRTLPHNIYLNLATQVCNGLEALHGRPGKASGAENVLHHALQPSAILLTAEGKLLVGNYGLVRSPTSLPHGGAGTPTTARMEYLSPEQTHPDQKLTPASDIFSLGSVLYELLTLEPLFRAESNLQTIHRVRRAEVTTPLLRVKEMLPGLDKVLYRALSLNPRHRYQRAFVLREDLRGLMSGFSFARISDETREFLAPLFEARRARGAADPQAAAPADDSTAGFLASLREPSGKTPPPAPSAGSASTGPDDTAALIRKAQSQAEKKAGPSTIVPVPEPDGPPSITDAPEQTSWEHNPLERTAWERNAVPRTDAVPPAMPSITDAPPPRRTAVQGGTPLQSAPPAPAAPPAPPKPLHLDGPGTPSGRDAAPGHPRPRFQEPNTTWTSAPPAAEKSSSPMSLPPAPAMREKLEQEAKRPTPSPAERRPTPAAPAPATGVSTPPAEKKAEPKYSTPGPSPRPNEFDDEPETNRAPPGSTGTPAPAPPAQRKSLADAAPPPRATPVPPPPVTSADDDDLDFDAPQQGGSRTWMFVAGGVAVVALLACVGIVGTGGVAGVLYSKEATTSAIAPGTPSAPSTPASTPPATDATSTPASTATPPSGTTSAAPATTPTPTTAGTTTTTTTTSAGASPTTSASAPSTSSGTASSTSPSSGTTSSGTTSSSSPSSGTTSSSATSTPRTTTTSSASSPSTSSGSTSSASSRPSSGTSSSSPSSMAFSDAGTTSSASTSSRPTSPTTSTSSKTPTSSSTGSSVDVGFSTPSTSRTTSSSSTTAAASTPKTSPSTSKTASIAAFDLAPPDVTPAGDGADLGLGLPAGPGNLDDYTDKAHRGALSDADRDALEGVASTDPTWSRSRVLLYEDAKARKDGRAQKQYLDDLMSVPENQYNPTLLVEQAEMAIQRKDYKTAVDRATKAEQYWARLPSDLVFSRKAMIYEIEAAGWQGIFYDSGGENTEALDNAVRCWEKYQRHVETKQRQDLMQKADEELAKLYDMQKRLE